MFGKESLGRSEHWLEERLSRRSHCVFLVRKFLLAYSAVSRILKYRAGHDSTLLVAAELQWAPRHVDRLRMSIASPSVDQQVVAYPIQDLLC